MNRSIVHPLRHVSRRGSSTVPPQRFLNRLRLWPFVKRPEPVQYRLQILRPRFHTTRLVARRTVRILLGASILYYFLPFSISVGLDDDGKEAMVDDGSLEVEEKNEEDDEPGLFIPLTWPMECERTFYKGSDPEWQEYMKFAKDKESQKRAHQAVVMHCRQAFIDVPDLARAIGQVNVNKGKYWLDVDFPLGPPPEYEQIGVEFTSSFVALAAQSLSQQEYLQLARYFDAKAALRSATSAVSNIAFNAQGMLMSVLGKEPSQNASPKGNGGYAGMPPGSGTSVGPVGTMGPIGPPIGPRSPATQNDHQEQNEVADEDNAEENAIMARETTQNLRKFFTSIFSQPMDAAPPRGSIVLQGLVECHGTQFVATVDVIAAWDLSEEQIVMHNTKIRHITPRRIAPRGGSKMPPFNPQEPRKH